MTYDIDISPYICTHTSSIVISTSTSFMLHTLSTIRHSETLDLSENMLLKSIIHNTNVFASLDDLKYTKSNNKLIILISFCRCLHYVYCGANK